MTQIQDNTIYISIDVEADGPIPGVYSMLSLGAAALRLDYPGHTLVGTFKRNLLPLPGAIQDPNTMQDFWAKHPAAWKASTEGAIEAEQAMKDFVAWLFQIKRDNGNAPLVVVGFPITYDFMFVYWYTIRFTGFPSPFGFQGLDIKTLVMERLQCAFKHAAKRNMPKRWFNGCPKHNHDALDDALGQGILAMNIFNDKEPSPR